MRVLHWMVLAACAVALVSCARRPPEAPAPATQPATAPAKPAALLALDEIEPPAVLPPKPAMTRPAALVPLEALHLYARARAESDRSATNAIALLRKALDLDPESFELSRELGLVYARSGLGNESAIRWLEKAATIDPGHIDVYYQLARLYLAKQSQDLALEKLRLATQTRGYQSDPEHGALVDFLLARLLQQRGYDTAALDAVRSLLSRLEGRLSPRGNPDLFFIVSRPESILTQAGQLAQKLGRHAEALRYFERAAAHQPDSFEHQSRRVGPLMELGRGEEARKLATDLVSRHRASLESVQLFQGVYKRLGRSEEVVPALRDLLKNNPDDKSIAFAIAETLATTGKEAEARKLLEELLLQSNHDLRVVIRLFEFLMNRGDAAGAGKLIVESLARNPDALDELTPLFQRLTRFSTKGRLRLPAMEKLSVEPWAEASKQYWTALLARPVERTTLASASLEKAAAAGKPFGPAYRELLHDYLSRGDWTLPEREQAAKKLIARAEAGGDTRLSIELRGLLALRLGRPADAVKDFTILKDSARPQPRELFALASALIATGEVQKAESLLWRLLSDHPTYEGSYAILLNLYLRRTDGARQAINVLQNWLRADPYNINARLLQATIQSRSGDTEAAELTLVNLFREEPDRGDVVTALARFYLDTGKDEELVRRLEDHRAANAHNTVVARWLVELYEEKKRPADALRVLEEARAGVAGDPDQLYLLAHVYQNINQQQRTEDVLGDVLKLEPGNVLANNDLGYMWADAGKNLDKSEAMIRVAVEAEPTTSAFLDSLGWVLYKRGKFAEAHQYLDKAVKVAEYPDPVVLDHLADSLYRLDRRPEALEVWKRSLKRLDEMRSDRDDLKKLRLEVRQKIAQQEGGKPVNVAPIVESAPNKN